MIETLVIGGVGSAVSLGITIAGYLRHRHANLPAAPLGPLRCQSCRADVSQTNHYVRHALWSQSYLCNECALRGHGDGGILTPVHVQADAPIEPPEPAPAREDTFWLDVVGIPLDLWCSMAVRCDGPHGFQFAPGCIEYLARRRDAGDFREKVDLVKHVVVPERPAIYEEREDGSASWRLDELDREITQSMGIPMPSIADMAKGFEHPRSAALVRREAKVVRDGIAEFVSAWLREHSPHGAQAKTAGSPFVRDVETVCEPCHETVRLDREAAVWCKEHYEQPQVLMRLQCQICGSNQVTYVGGLVPSATYVCQCCGSHLGSDTIQRAASFQAVPQRAIPPNTGLAHRR